MQPTPPEAPKEKQIADAGVLRGYEQLYAGYCRDCFSIIHAAILTDKLHSLIAPVIQELLELMNTGSPHIQYYDLRYALGQDGCPYIPESV